MRKRKTVDIVALVMEVNYRNKESTCSKETREGWNSLLESILMQTENYHGFGYLTKENVPVGCEPGMVWDKDANKAVSFPDETRRYYYYKK